MIDKKTILDNIAELKMRKEREIELYQSIANKLNEAMAEILNFVESLEQQGFAIEDIDNISGGTSFGKLYIDFKVFNDYENVTPQIVYEIER